jgi:hemerythrin-like domain-containing protein
MARRLFGAHRVLLEAHMGYEENLLLPELERAVHTTRWPNVLYFGQHDKMQRFLERIARGLSDLPDLPALRARPTLKLLDIEATFLHLVEHHNQAEESALYPELERGLPEESKNRLAATCSEIWSEAERQVGTFVAEARAVLTASD